MSLVQTCLPAPRRPPPGSTSRGRLTPVLAGLAGLAAVSLVAVSALSGADRPYFDAGDAWWTPVPGQPRLDADDEALSEVLASAPGPASLNIGAFGQPVYQADEDTPRYEIPLTRAGTDAGDWGDNALLGMDIPVPDGARPSTGSDAKLVVVDRDAGLVYDLWGVRRTPGGWEAAWGGLYELDGDGTSDRVAYGEGPDRVAYPEPLSRGTGSGVSSLAGVLRADELLAGAVEHALVFATDMPCGPADTGPHRYPATSTDGFLTDQPCLPQGARVQLDPSLDLSSLSLTPVELTVARALQEYGAYLVDKSGNRFALIAEVPSPRQQRELAGLGVEGDYHYLDGIPMDRFRVLASWDGS